MIWKYPFTLEALNQSGNGTLVENLGIEFTESGDDYLMAKMPVDKRTIQPQRLLHGGASVALAETLGSMGSFLCIDPSGDQMPVGVEINANHIRPATQGNVHGKATPIRLGKNMHVWNIEIKDDDGRLICVSRITIALVQKR